MLKTRMFTGYFAYGFEQATHALRALDKADVARAERFLEHRLRANGA